MSFRGNGFGFGGYGSYYDSRLYDQYSGYGYGGYGGYYGDYFSGDRFGGRFSDRFDGRFADRFGGRFGDTRCSRRVAQLGFGPQVADYLCD